MKIALLTLFPNECRSFLNASIIARAESKGKVELYCEDIRNFAVNKYGSVDDTLYGGGRGMLLRPEPLFAAYQSALAHFAYTHPVDSKKVLSIYFSPRGQALKQAALSEYLDYELLVLICGHYEGIDQRFLDLVAARELSIGDYILSNGELAALTFTDALSRLIPGVLPSEEAYTHDSLVSGLLEEDQYTKPAVWMERSVPTPLLEGNHAAIKRWRMNSAIKRTVQQRPELFYQALQDNRLSQEDIAEFAKEYRQKALENMENKPFNT